MANFKTVKELNNLNTLSNDTSLLVENNNNNYYIIMDQLKAYFLEAQSDYIKEQGEGGHTSIFAPISSSKLETMVSYDSELFASLIQSSHPLKYRKWNSGISECWGILQYPLEGRTGNIGSGKIPYISNLQTIGERNLNYNYFFTYDINTKIIDSENDKEYYPLEFPPELFIDTPVVTTNIIKELTTIGSGSDVTHYGPRILNTAFSIKEVDENMFKGELMVELESNKLQIYQSPPIHFHAIGRWK